MKNTLMTLLFITSTTFVSECASAEPTAMPEAPAGVASIENKSFQPGELWKDHNGVPINAHGGGILFHNGIYYWFGEHKVEGTLGNTAQVGVHVYSSKDLYDWKDEGIALAVSDDPQSEITKGCILERPKVIYNAKTGKFVMWFHLELKGQGYKAARSGVAVADTPTGPFTYLYSMRPNAGVWPLNFPKDQQLPLSPKEFTHLKSLKISGGNGANSDGAKGFLVRRDFEGGQMARDMTLFVDDDGTAYHVFASEENSTLHISQLSEDYLKPAGRYIRTFEGQYNEAPALMKHLGKYYLISSGCTGWAPNAARSAVADEILGNWTSLGNPSIGTEEQKKTTFDSQSTHILPVDGKPGAFIFMADRWRPKNAIDGRYVWLPLQFDARRHPILEWKDKWDLRAFERKPAVP